MFLPRWHFNPPQGVVVEGRYGNRMMFTLVDGRVMYVPPIVATRIEAEGIAAGERFEWASKQATFGPAAKNPAVQSAGDQAAHGADQEDRASCLRRCARVLCPIKTPIEPAGLQSIQYWL